MMWFKRPEFDRFARFKSHGSAHEFFDYGEMCEVELPIPSIQKQREIVKEYNTIVNRIALNEKLNQKLEETAQAIYRQWFVEFEFPNEDGKPYKSSGGKMVWCEELEKEVPEGWEVDVLSEFIDVNSNNINLQKDKFENIQYYDTSSVTNNTFTEPQLLNSKLDEIPSRAKRKVKFNDLIYSTVRPNLKHFGLIKSHDENIIVSTGFAVITSIDDIINNEFLLLLLSNQEIIDYFQSKAEMSVSTYPSIKPEDILNTLTILPQNKEMLVKIMAKFNLIFKTINQRDKENLKILEIKNLLLSKMTKVETEKEMV